MTNPFSRGSERPAACAALREQSIERLADCVEANIDLRALEGFL